MLNANLVCMYKYKQSIEIMVIHDDGGLYGEFCIVVMVWYGIAVMQLPTMP